MSTPRIAVVIPCYNDGATLPETLTSLEAQEPVELVIVDDGSTDEATLSLFRELERDGVKVVHQGNQGLSAARMTGVAATSAPYVYPLDADDILVPEALTWLADALDADPAAVAAWGVVRTMGDHDVRFPGRAQLDPWLVTYCTHVPGTSLFRRASLLEAGGWRLREAYEDWDLWMSFAELGRQGVYVPRQIFWYRLHGRRMAIEARGARHGEILAKLQTRHPGLFAARSQNWRHSTAPLRARLLFPLYDRLPLSMVWYQRLIDVTLAPARIAAVKLRRFRR